MLRTAYVDDQVAARDFSTGDVVRKTDFRGFFPSPYAGRVVYSDPKTGTVQVQWPWGAEQEEPTELIRDTSGQVMPPEALDQSYSTWELARYFSNKETEKADAKWRKSLSSARGDTSLISRVARRYEEMTKPLWRAACMCHHRGLDEISAFAALSRFAGTYGTDAVRITLSNLYEAGRRPLVALYWKEQGRRYKVTKREKSSGQLQCPRCSTVGMRSKTYRKNKKVLSCTACGFAISPKDLLWGDERDQQPAPLETTAVPEPVAVASGRATAFSSYGRNILRLARTMSSFDPILGDELDSVVRRLAVVNPGVVTWEKNLDEMLATLKSLDQELGQALEDYETAEEYAKFFQDGIAEEEELKKILDRTGQLGKVASGAHRTAGFGDFWKKMKRKLDWSLDDEDESRTMQNPDYVLDDQAIDDFVEGSREWSDASEYIEEEFKENREFFKDAHGVLDQMEKIRKNPTRDAIRTLRDSLPEIIKRGQDMLEGTREHLQVSPIELEDGEGGLEGPAPFEREDDISTDVVPQVTEDEDEEGEALKEGSPESFDFAVRHYVDMLRDSLDDPEKTKKYLRELYREVGPELERAASPKDDPARAAARCAVFSVLVRTARQRPSSRGFLIPLLREISGR